MKAPRRNGCTASLIIALGVVLVHAQIVFADGRETSAASAQSGQPPAFSSAASATFTMGTAGTFTVAVSGSPAPTVQVTGVLPTGIGFAGGSGGSAVLAGTPAPGTVGRYTITLSASNGVGSPATQAFTLTVVLPIEPALAVAATDAWWQRPAVPILSHTPYTNDVATVEGWAGTAETPTQAATLKLAADIAHAYGRRYVAAISGYDASWETYAVRPDLVAAAVIDIYGQPIGVPWESSMWWGNWNLPVWQSFLLEQARAAVDAGVDGIIIDEVDGTAGSLNYGGSFAPEDMSLFRCYLSRMYTAADLQSRYGIADLTTFDYGDYIRARGLAATWKASPYSVPLHGDFLRMQQEASLQFLTLLIGTTRDYARAHYGRYVTFSVNTYAMAYSVHAMAPLLDYFSVEYPFNEVGSLPDDTPVADLKLAAALGSKSAWLLPSVLTVGDWYGRTIDTQVKLQTALAYAGGGALFSPYNWYGYSDATGPVNLQRDVRPLRPFYSMAREYSTLLSSRASVANVALLYSKASEQYWWTGYRASYRGTARALLNGHVQYDVVAFEDGEGIAESPGVQALARYSVAYLPTAICLSAGQVDDVLSWVDQGGTLVLYGLTGIWDLHGATTSLPHLDPYRSPGSRTRGAGRVITAASDLGAAYRTDPSASNLAAVLQYVVAGPTQRVTTDAPGNVIVLADLVLSGTALAVHVINGNYDPASDSVGTLGPMHLTVNLVGALQSATALQAYRLSPDRTSVDLLSVTRGGASATVSLPDLSLYDVIVVMDASTASAFSTPVVSRFTDTLAAAAAKGRDVSSLVATRDAINAALASNNYVRARHLAQAAQPDADRANGHRVLFSEAHNERNTLSPARAELIYPGNAGWALASRLIAELPADFAVERSESAITPALLAGYDVLWLAASSSAFQPAEITAIHNFVAAGGGLLVLGDYGLNASLTPITSTYGISLTGTFVFNFATPPTGDMLAGVVLQHDAVRGVPWLWMNWGTTLSTTSAATVLMKTDDGAFADVDADKVLDPTEQKGPLAVVAVSGAGLGRVFVASDNPILDEAFDNRMPLPWVRAALGWLVRNSTGPQPLDLTPPSVAVGSGGSQPSTTASAISLSGTAGSRVGVSSVTWSSNASHGVAVGTTSWTTGPVSLALGPNRVTIVVTDLDGNATVRTVSVTRLRPRADFDGDRSADAAVYRPASGTWFSLDSSNANGSYRYRGWGLQAMGDVPVVGDFDGDGILDPTVFRPASGTWFVLESHAGFSTWTWFGWGVSTDTRVPSDYDGDGMTDGAIYRPSSGEWFIRPSSGASPWSLRFGGTAGDTPVPGDYDGDGKTDLAIYRPATGTWFILTSSSNFTSWTYHGWGLQAQGDVPVPGDYDADGKTDLAVFRPGTGTWFILESHADFSTWQWFGWGVSTDQLMPADYDGDGVTDGAIYRPSTHEWYVRPSSGASPWSVVFGQAGDTPLRGIR